MAIYSKATICFDVSKEIQDEYHAGIGPISQKYIDAGYVKAQFPSWDPPLPNNIYPPSGGTYVATREWTDLEQAQAQSAEANAWLDAHPHVKAMNPGPRVVVK